jgi:diguanylate cyclase (GGDEF)-like protein
MDDSLADVMRLLRLAQTGQPEVALAEADRQLVAGHSPGILYARAVALHRLGDHEAAAGAAELMLAAGAAGWQSIALSFRACQHILLGEIDPQSFDLEATLHDLSRAEAALSNDVVDGFVLSTAHTGLGHGFNYLRLYELALPHYEAALAAALSRSADVAAMMAVKHQLNLAELHLNWSVELHRIRDVVGAQEKSVIAARHAALAQEYANTEETRVYAARAALLAACADSTGTPERVVARLRDGLQAVESQGRTEGRAFALPFLAWALDRAGRLPEAIQVSAEACDALPTDATWRLKSAAYHTRARLLAQSGSDSARAALVYGDQLAETMWQHRLYTLHSARSMQILKRVTLERDRVQVLANTDALTGVGNRRAFDVRIAELGASATDVVAMIVVDVDRLKAVNDADGHAAGDRTLQAVAGALTSQVRPGDLVARLGGEEFVAVLIGMDRADAGEVAQRMVSAVSAALGSTVTVSLGVATGPASEAGSSLLRAADRAMYAAKRNRRVVATGSQPAVEDVSRRG